MSTDPRREARSLARFIDSSPSPYHACAEAAVRLEQAGFRRLSELEAWDHSAGRAFVVRGGSLVAWVLAPDTPAHAGFRIVGAHTDSPNLRIKPRPDCGKAGYRQLGVEVYGGVLLNTWLDRDLGLSGRAWVRTTSGLEERLFLEARPLLRVPQLAIHLDRSVNTDGLKLNPQEHLAPVYGLGDGHGPGFHAWLAELLGVREDALLSYDAMCHDLAPASLLGAGEEFLSAPRLDNLASCHCALSALEGLVGDGAPEGFVPVVSLYDHEEVGSASRAGADGPLLSDVLERTVLARGGEREAYHRALAASVSVSADMAHATHPNYVGKHDPEHHLAMNAGPVIKINASQRYATESETEARFQDACERAGVPFQKWVNRSDLACGSTIGPVSAAHLGVRTVDVGMAQLAMHSARELCGSLDPALMVRALRAFWD